MSNDYPDLGLGDEIWNGVRVANSCYKSPDMMHFAWTCIS